MMFSTSTVRVSVSARDVSPDGLWTDAAAVIVHVVPEPDQRRDQVFLQRKARMIRPDRDTHKMD